MNLEEAKKEFLNYTEGYKAFGKSPILKIHHTFRVMALCREIAQSLNLSNEDVELAMMTGLLHDIGRFEQWRIYETFDDAGSIDHAALGVDILKKNNYLNCYLQDPTLQKTLLHSIYYHNKYKVEESLSDRDKMFCNIIRDADKIDILYLYTVGELAVDTGNDSFCEKIYQDLLDGKQIERKDKTTKGDMLAVSLGFPFDINFPKSFEILRRKDYMNQEIDLYLKRTKNLELQEQLKEVRKKIDQYIEERKSYVR